MTQLKKSLWTDEITNKLVDDVNETFSNDFINTVCDHKM